MNYKIKFIKQYSSEIKFFLFLPFIFFAIGYDFFSGNFIIKNIDDDASIYIGMIENNFNYDYVDHRSSRILIPYLASLIYNPLLNNIGTWDEARFSLFIIYCLFLILGLFIYKKISDHFDLNKKNFKITTLIFLLSFCSINYLSRGLIDIGDFFFTALLTLYLVKNQYLPLIIIFIFGTLNKETFIPIASGIIIFDFIYKLIILKEKISHLLKYFVIAFIAVIFGCITLSFIHIYFLDNLKNIFDIFIMMDNLPTWEEKRSLLEEIRRFLYVLLPFFLFGLIYIFKLPLQIRFHILGGLLVIIFGSIISSVSGTALSRYLFTIYGFYFSYCITLNLFSTIEKD